jgi:hypothetical protein
LKQSSDKLCETVFPARSRESWASAELVVVVSRSFAEDCLKQSADKLCERLFPARGRES